MKSVLVVDDEQSIVLGVELLLAQDYRVLKAYSGEEALLMVKDCKPDLILLDIMMPGLGGLEALKILRSHPSYKKVPVVMMSGARPLVRQSEFGWSSFLDKPFGRNELFDVIAKYI